jgi:hypothetical protein
VFRKALLFFFIALFVILLPIILLYAFGFRWDSETERLTRTGLITVKSFPEDTSIYLNGDLIQNKTPVDIPGLLPGDYEVELLSKKYWPYFKKIKVEADRVTRMEDIRLFPKAPKIKSILHPSEISAFFLSPTGQQILFFVKDSTEENLYLLDVGRKTLKALYRLPSEYVKQLNLAKASWSTNENFILLQTEDLNFVLSLDLPSSSFVLDDVLGFKPNRVKMGRSRGSELYLLKDGFLSRFDLKNRVTKEMSLEKISDFEPSHFGIVFLQADTGEVFRANKEGRGVKRLGKFRGYQDKGPLKWQSTDKAFLAFDRSKWAALDAEGNFYVLEPSFYHPAVRGFQFSLSGEKILFWNDYELWILEEVLPEEGGSGSPKYKRELIFESEIPIQEALWSPDESYVYLVTHRKVYALEVNVEGGINLYPFYVSKDHFVQPNGWAVNEDEELFYWISEDSEQQKHFRSLYLSIGFLDPLVAKMTDQVSTFKTRIQESKLMSKTKTVD